MWISSQWSILYEYTCTAARVRHADLPQACVILARNSSYWSQIRRQVLYLDGLFSSAPCNVYCLVFYAQAALCIFVEYDGHIYDSYHFVSVLCVKIVSCHRGTVTIVSRQQYVGTKYGTSPMQNAECRFNCLCWLESVLALEKDWVVLIIT